MTSRELYRYIFWEWIEPIGTALGIALLVMKFIMAIYVIPTGSMQPTLHGAGDYGLGDKVLVNKFIYRMEEPKRWDVIVFKYPNHLINCKRCGHDLPYPIPKDQPRVIPEGAECPRSTCIGLSPKLAFISKDYIKRCVGVPGDELTLRDGNILVKEGDDWAFTPKTEAAQSEMWVDVFDSSKEDDIKATAYYWQWLSDEQVDWGGEREILELEANKEYRLRFKNEDSLRGKGDKGLNETSFMQPVRPLVGDVKLTLSLEEQPQNGVLDLEIAWNNSPLIARLDFSNHSVALLRNGQALSSFPFSPELKEISFARLDGELLFYSKDKIERVAIPDLSPITTTASISPKINYKGDALKIASVEVKRDIYYSREMDQRFWNNSNYSCKIYPGEYFAMGDNSFFSSDSRYWGKVPESDMIGKALAVLLPFPRIKLIY
ncbi:MAG: signal peptidase I [Planctomycetes bacterium]|nr:signal peptidase I [Planctomycetota bacterium]